MTTSTDSISVAAAGDNKLPELKPGTVVAGRFEVVARVGEGMLGATYKVKSRKTGELQALKVFEARHLKSGMTSDSFADEIRLNGRLKHPGVVQYLDAGEHEGLLWCSMEWVEGKSMREWLEDYKSRSEDPPGREVQEILVQALDALVVTHAAEPPGIHGHLKPENILLATEKGPDGKPRRRVKLTDFFIARTISSGVFENEATRTGASYMAPEVTGLGGRLLPCVDTYSIGVIFYEALTGQPPRGTWQMPSELRPKELTQAVDDTVGIALSLDAQDRFQTATDMLEAMKAMTSGLGGELDPRIRLLAGAMGVVFLVAMVAGFIYLTSLPSPAELEQQEKDRWASVRAELAAQAQPPVPAVDDSKYENMVWVPGGKFVRGRWAQYDTGGETERPEAIVDVGGFWIDKEEAFTPATEILPEDPPEVQQQKAAANSEALKPLREMQHGEAQAHCANLGKRLCSEDEWEKACKGPTNSIYAYGDEFKSSLCPPSGWKLREYDVGEFDGCLSGYGVHNLGGGLLEWTSESDGANYIVKGGEVGNESKGTRCAGRASLAPSTEQPHIGVRCCAD